MKCYSWTLDTVGLFAAGVEDLAHGLSAMTHRPELLPGAAMKAPRIGVVTQDFADAPEAASAEALSKDAGDLWDSGKVVSDGPWLEKHLPTFNPRTGLGGIEIWIPVM